MKATRDYRMQFFREKIGGISRRSLHPKHTEVKLVLSEMVWFQIGGILINRVKGCEQEWLKEQRHTTAMNNFDFEINDQAVLEQIRQLDFIKNKRECCRSRKILYKVIAVSMIRSNA